MTYIAIVKTIVGKVDKYQEFSAQSDAEAHVVLYGGYVAPHPGGSFAYWICDSVAKTLTRDTARETADAAERAKKSNNAPILAELSSLDAYIPRGLEDYWTAIAFDTAAMPAPQRARLARKAALRGALVP